MIDKDIEERLKLYIDGQLSTGLPTNTRNVNNEVLLVKVLKAQYITSLFLFYIMLSQTVLVTYKILYGT